MPEQIQRIIDNLVAMGGRRLAIMAAIGALVIAVVGVGSVYLNRPGYETLYVGLERSDVNQIGIVLGEAGIQFDVAADGTAVLVPVGKTGQARMLLAEKGLPTSTNAGYELFDNVGSLGLTSFMQQVTKVRALEGEIARTIQSIAGIKAARVHIVMSERGNFRQEEQQPSASVVIRTSGLDGGRSANSIRHLVAAAVPGLSTEKVTVLDSTGALLAAGDDPASNSANRSMGVERTVENQIEDNIHRALAPYLGNDNFRTSVRAEVNTDTRQIEETIFDPESRIERSIQVIRENDKNNQSSAATPASVDQNLPQPAAPATAGPQTNGERDRKEEITNYEINSKRIATVSNGYTVSKLSIAVVVNEARLKAVLGDAATPELIAGRVAAIRDMVSSAAGFTEARGDHITVNAVEFIAEMDAEAAGGLGMLEMAGRHVGTVINAGAFITVVFLVAWFGLRPLTAALGNPVVAAGASFDDVQRALPPTAAENLQIAAANGIEGGAAPRSGANPIDELRNKLRPAPQDRLARMLELNEERTAQILRKWAHQEAS
ncbi:MAG: flagellar basal-body MS-ring/collar protein FliF [Mesorhizobium sp.]|nr:flagellar basal-body MS-ring/collar protein FliF [Mesorhizobium sp.]